MQSEMSKLSPPTGGLCLPISKHAGILTNFQTKVKIKISHKGHRGHREISHEKASAFAEGFRLRLRYVGQVGGQAPAQI
jgi:hypothetical protein